MSNQIIKSDNHDGCEVMNSCSLSDVTRGLSKKKKLTFLTWECFSAIIVQTSDTSISALSWLQMGIHCMSAQTLQ